MVHSKRISFIPDLAVQNLKSKKLFLRKGNQDYNVNYSAKRTGKIRLFAARSANLLVSARIIAIVRVTKCSTEPHERKFSCMLQIFVGQSFATDTSTTRQRVV